MEFATLIAGPTASGKSALALRLAKSLGGWVVNADSIQVYADLSVLSARPTPEEEASVPHRLFGFVPSRAEYSVGRYIADVAPLIEAARAGGPPLVIVGGTGLYFRALTEGLMPSPAIPEVIRAEWRARAASGEDMHAELHHRDPARAAQLAPRDTPRILRAIELFEATGRRYSDWLRENPGVPLLRKGEWRGAFLNPDRDWLSRRIDARFLAMLDNGALEEMRRLEAITPPLPANLGVMKAHGAPHLVRHLSGDMSLEEAIARGQQDTRAYARRQLIFARRYLAGEAWRWIGSGDDYAA
ncbi:MAG: tRNA (adenosine(37)-N6)-dimethylallyltransferase MiaA [Rhizobiales bacterium]|nr:tRNA (adenosine(37)-N6)-dimethylallyltransferase MiaA [Hyphomicrobiales bacterium]